jgi:hypothetical protein
VAHVGRPEVHQCSVFVLSLFELSRDPTKLSFKVHGTTVRTADAKSMCTKGIVGLRANHNHDLHIEGFAVHQ